MRGRRGILVRNRQSSLSLDTAASAFLLAAGISDLYIKVAINDLVIAWKNLGQWDRTIAIYPFVGGTPAAHKFNLKDPRDLDAANRITFGGTMTHNSNGITTDGSTSFGNTHIDLNLQVPQYSVSAGFYNRTAAAPGAGDYFLCGANQDLRFDIYSTNRLNINSNQTNYSTGSSTSTSVTGNATWTGLLGFSQNGPSSMSVYREKSRLTHDTTEVRGYWKNTGTIANRKLWMFGNNNNGVIQFPLESRSIALAFVAYGMDQTTWNLISDAVTAFQTALGRNV